MVFTLFNALLECGCFYMYRIMNVSCLIIFNALLVWWVLYVPPYGCVVFTIFNAFLECGCYYMYRMWCFIIFNALLLWSLLYVPHHECVVFTIFNALLECGGYYMYRITNVSCLLYLMPY